MNQLRPDEADFVASFWDYDDLMPNKPAYFRWMIDNLPNVCVRNHRGEPISWGLQYQIGAGAARYTLPDYRRLGLVALFGPAIFAEHTKVSSVPYYVDIAVGNEITKGSVTKKHLMNSGFKFIWIAAKPNISSKI